MRTAVAGVLAGLLVAALAASAGASEGNKPPAPPVPPVAVVADLDGDKLFDDLEGRLAELTAEEEVSVLVALRAPARADRIDALEGQVGPLKLEAVFSIVDGFAATMTKGQAEALARLPGVRHVEQNDFVSASNDTAQSAYGVKKARLDAGVDGDGDGNSATYSTDDLVAAVVDTGIDAAHGDLDEGKVLVFVDCTSGSCVPTAPFDDNGHGTHVAATIAGEGDARADRLYRGAAPAAALVGVKVLDAAGYGTDATVIAGVDWARTHKAAYGIEAVNLSLGAQGCSDGTDLISQAVNQAHAAGLVVSVAAGNSGPGTCTIGSPAAAENALTVGAMADFGGNSPAGFYQAPFSSRGKTFDGRIKPDVSAPGVGVTSARRGTSDQYVTYNGTSMAAPFVAGVALLMLDVDPTLTPHEIRDTMMETAVDWGRGGDSRTPGTIGKDIEYGAGRLDAYAAIEAAAGVDIGAPPPVPAHSREDGDLAGTSAFVDYELQIVDADVPIAATLIIASITGAGAASPDFDLYLLDPTGVQVGSATSALRQDQLGHDPAGTGNYTLRVVSYSGAGGFFVDVSAGMVPPQPVEVTEYEPEGYQIVTGRIYQGTGDVARLDTDDGVRLEVKSKNVAGTHVSETYAFANITAEERATLSRLTVSYDGNVNRKEAEVTLRVYNWTTASYEPVDGPWTGVTSDRATVWSTSASPVDYVSPSGELRFAVRATRVGAGLRTRTDLVRFTIVH